MRHIDSRSVPIIKGKVDPSLMGPAPTPTPTPAPTPVIEMVNGKIKQLWEAPAEYAKMKSPLKVTADIVKKGQGLYKNRCEICHGAEGKGNGPYNDPKWKQSTNLASQVVQANSDGELFYKVSSSRDRHPASKVLYSDEERWMIVAFLRTLK
jgi:mono/diheme cytochrome c family protein